MSGDYHRQQLLDRTEQALFQVSESHIRKNYDKMSSLLTKAISQIEERKNQKDGITGVPSGFTALDRITSGWQPSDLVIIAARPGMGKTAFVVSAMRNAAIDHGQGVAIFSLEMSSVQLVNRLISSEAELESEKLKEEKWLITSGNNCFIKPRNFLKLPYLLTILQV